MEEGGVKTLGIFLSGLKPRADFPSRCQSERMARKIRTMKMRRAVGRRRIGIFSRSLAVAYFYTAALSAQCQATKVIEARRRVQVDKRKRVVNQ